MNSITITDAQYMKGRMSNEVLNIRATIDGQELFVPLDPANRHYNAILKAVEAGDLVIQEADQP